jgi:hypothetical protein
MDELVEVKSRSAESNLNRSLLQCLPHLFPGALLFDVDGCGLLVVDPAGQAVGLSESVEDVPLAGHLEGVLVHSILPLWSWL